MASAEFFPVEQLADRARAGDTAAASQLLSELADRLLPTALALTRSPSDGRELVEDALSVVFERLGDLRTSESVIGWSRRVLVRRFLDSKRQKLRRREVQIELASAVTTSSTVEERLDVLRALDRLDRGERAVVVLRYWLGLTCEECADELAIPVGTVKSRLSAARRHLHATLGDAYA